MLHLNNEPDVDSIPLPVDVMREIIARSHDSIGALRQVSHVMSELVADHLSNRNNLPPVDELSLRNINPNIFEVTMHIRSSYRPAYANLKNMEFTNTIGWHTIVATNEITILKGTVAAIDLPRLSAHLGARIENLSLINFDAGSSAENIINCFSSIRVDKLFVIGSNIGDHYSQQILQLIHSCKVERIQFDIHNCRMENPKEFLLQVCDLVDWLFIKQHYSDDAHMLEEYLFGLHDENWGKLIAEMFAKRVSYIEIDNTRFLCHLTTRKEIRHLIKSVAAPGSRNVLKTKGSARYSMKSTMINGHLVKVGDSCTITIVHESRKNQQF